MGTAEGVRQQLLSDLDSPAHTVTEEHLMTIICETLDAAGLLWPEHTDEHNPGFNEYDHPNEHDDDDKKAQQSMLQQATQQSQQSPHEQMLQQHQPRIVNEHDCPNKHYDDIHV